MSRFDIKPLWESSRTLSAVAMGRVPAELVIKGARLVNVCTGEIIPDTDVAISCGRIALVGDAEHCIGESTCVIEAEGQYIAPGFLDGHVHVESSMLSVGEYAKTVIPRGTTGIYMDPHEICNVLGLDAVKCMAEDAARTPLKVMITTPSCVPAVPGFEDTGSFVGAEDVAETMGWENVVGLGEMMNFPGILSSDEQAHAIVGETLKAGKIATGHYSMPETGSGLNAYVAAGMRCCHETARAEDALAKMRLGMYVMIREGSAWRNLEEAIKSITQNKVDSRFAVLVSDDTHPHTLVSDGHMDHILRRAIAEGVNPITAIQMVTINCAQCFQTDHEIGSITPGKCADIVFMKNLADVSVTRVIINGEVVSEGNDMAVELEDYAYPDWVTNSIHIKDTITPESFDINADGDEVQAHVIEVASGSVATKKSVVALRPASGKLQPCLERDILKAAVFERHHKTGTVGFGFVKGFGIKAGAMASTVAHDAHNMLVIGANDEDMALAANTLINQGGGMAVVKNGEVLGCVPLPIAGLMNSKPALEMADKVEQLEAAWEQIGCTMVSPFMTMALIPLACIPEIRLTNRGLVDCVDFTFVPLITP